jgi:hypothetical protein
VKSYEPEPVKRLALTFYFIFFSFLLFSPYATFFDLFPKAASCSDRRPHENGPLKSSSEYGRRSRAGRSGRPQRNKT